MFVNMFDHINTQLRFFLTKYSTVDKAEHLKLISR